jgi:hypothetical protein
MAKGSVALASRRAREPGAAVREGRLVWTGTALEGAALAGEARTVLVTLIRPGRSANGVEYPADVLRAAAPLFEGAPAFVDHPSALDQGRAGGRSVRDLAGVYHGAHYAEGVGIRATLRLLRAAEWLWQLVGEVLRAREAGQPAPQVGLSADMVVRWVPGRGSERRAIEIVRVHSCDVVVQPSAGGAFERMLEGREEDAVTSETQAGVAMGTLSDELEALRRERAALRAQVLEAKLQASGLPAEAQAQVRRQLEGRAYTAAEVDEAIEGLRGLLARAVAPRVVQGLGGPRVSGVRTTTERIQAAVDRLFGLPLPEHLSDVPRLSGIREAYLLITGDYGFTGRYQWETSVIREANEVTTTVLSDVLGVSMNKRLVADYRAQVRWWEPVVTTVALRDMKAQERLLLNDFASLATVAENAAYGNLAWGDGKESYTPSKRGALVSVTLETIINDDLRAVQRIPSKLARAATLTINEFVATLFTQNGGAGPAMADGFTVFDATNHQGNSRSEALSSAALQNSLVVMAKFTNSAGKRLGLQGRYLLVPPDLEFTARVLTQSAQVPGSANNDANVLRGVVEPVVVPQFADTNNWYLMADPAAIEGLELGFLNGREEPELLVQDSPTEGSVFTNDAITWKVRHVYGGVWLDYRAAVANLVA